MSLSSYSFNAFLPTWSCLFWNAPFVLVYLVTMMNAMTSQHHQVNGLSTASLCRCVSVACMFSFLSLKYLSASKFYLHINICTLHDSIVKTFNTFACTGVRLNKSLPSPSYLIFLLTLSRREYTS